MAITTGDEVTFEYTARLDDGTVFDTSHESVAEDAGIVESQPQRTYQALTVTIGEQQIIQGLEEALLGLEDGDTETVTIPPEEAYGEWDEDQIQEYDADEFSQMIAGQEPEEGVHFETENGELGKLVHVDDEVVRIDFNHDLAGETLEFEIEITDVE